MTIKLENEWKKMIFNPLITKKLKMKTLTITPVIVDIISTDGLGQLKQFIVFGVNSNGQLVGTFDIHSLNRNQFYCQLMQNVKKVFTNIQIIFTNFKELLFKYKIIELTNSLTTKQSDIMNKLNEFDEPLNYIESLFIFQEKESIKITNQNVKEAAAIVSGFTDGDKYEILLNGYKLLLSKPIIALYSPKEIDNTVDQSVDQSVEPTVEPTLEEYERFIGILKNVCKAFNLFLHYLHSKCDAHSFQVIQLLEKDGIIGSNYNQLQKSVNDAIEEVRKNKEFMYNIKNEEWIGLTKYSSTFFV